MSLKYFACLWGYVFTLAPIFSYAQATEEDNIRFLNYLLESKQYEDAIFLSKQLIHQQNFTHYSPAYYAGFAHYNLRQLDSAAVYLSKVPESNPYFYKSRFFQGISLAYLKDYTQAKQVFSQLPPADSMQQELKIFEQAGLALLQKDYKEFNALSQKFTYQYFPFSQQENNLLTYQHDLLQVKKRSPVVAGLLSAVVPGAGKVYAGQLGQGVAIFLQNTIFALQAYEGYRKDGPRSARFIIYSSLFTVFYIGNVWGSVLSVQIKRQQMYDKINNQIVFDMHIPLRTIFN